MNIDPEKLLSNNQSDLPKKIRPRRAKIQHYLLAAIVAVKRPVTRQELVTASCRITQKRQNTKSIQPHLSPLINDELIERSGRAEYIATAKGIALVRDLKRRGIL